jgi:Lar family restriction alleviation protein
VSERESLKPCPFCGGEAEIWRARPERPSRNAWIACMDRCAVMTKEYPTDAEAIAAWNTRARPEPSEAVVEAVARAMCRHIGDDPDLQMSGGEARWEWLAGHARAAIAAYEGERSTDTPPRSPLAPPLSRS